MRTTPPGGGSRPGRGAASAKFRRRPSHPAEQAKRVAFGAYWSKFNRQEAARLRAMGG